MKELFEQMNLEATKDMYMAYINTPTSSYLCFIPIELKEEIKKSPRKLYDFLIRSDFVIENGKLIKSKLDGLIEKE